MCDSGSTFLGTKDPRMPFKSYFLIVYYYYYHHPLLLVARNTQAPKSCCSILKNRIFISKTEIPKWQYLIMLLFYMREEIRVDILG